MTEFMDLPAELRLRIYGYVLEQDHAIQLEIRIHWKCKGGREVVRRGAHRNFLHRGQVKDKKSKTWGPAEPENAAILYTCRQIYLEAEPVLYGQNIFSFTTTTALKDFLKLIGKRTQHLRMIRIEAHGYVNRTARGALKLLTAAKGLQKLEYHHTIVCGVGQDYFYPPNLPYDCKNLLRALQKARQGKDKNGLASEILSIWQEDECAACANFHIAPPHFGGTNTQTQNDKMRLWKNMASGQSQCFCSSVDDHNQKLTVALRLAASAYLQPNETVESA